MDSDLDISDDSSQLSSRSRFRSPSQSITNSHGSQASEGEDGIPPKASKSKRRSELAAYASLLRRLETAKRSRPLAHRLLRPRGRSSSSSSSSDSSSPSREGSAELLARERNTSGPSSSHGSSTQDRFLDDTWPLNRFEILACAYYSGDDLAEVVKSIARSYIRIRGLQLSGSTPSQDFSNVADEDDIPVPTNLVNSTVELLDRALVSIAATRPCDVGRVRKGYRSINGQSVLAAAAVLAGAEEVVSATNTRVRELTRESQADDRLQHRLEVLAAAKARRSKGFTHALYGPAVPALPPPKRRHQSKAELERREAKRLAKKLKREAS